MANGAESKILFENESYKIRGACFKVYNTLGGGIKEKTIERAVLKELENEKLITEFSGFSD